VVHLIAKRAESEDSARFLHGTAYVPLNLTSSHPPPCGSSCTSFRSHTSTGRCGPDSAWGRLQAIEAEVNGEPAITSTRPPSPILEKLTPRERDIVKLVAEGASNKEIAAKLHLSENTVRNRLGDILGKLGVSNRTQVAIWARENGLGGEQ